MKTILVTGGAGFAGHHVIEHILTTTSHNVIVLDSLTYAGRVDRLTDIDVYDPARVEIIWHDLRAPIHKHLADRLAKVTSVLHLAAESHVDRSITDPVPFVTNNFLATLNLLEWAREHGRLEHFVQISTDEVYGPAPANYAHKEWIDPMLPSNPYSASKVSQEALAISYWRTYGVPLTITNTMNLFGERQHPEKFLPMVIRNIALGNPVILHGKPVEVDEHTIWHPSERHWLHARNHADALLWIIDQTSPTMYDNYPNFKETPRPNRWHVAGERHSVIEIAEIVAKILDKTLFIRWEDYHSSRPGHDHRYALDSTKIHEAGWNEPFSFDASIARTVKWMFDNDRWLRDY
jgi:dTDP-glucose 4,6-dehydratase